MENIDLSKLTDKERIEGALAEYILISKKWGVDIAARFSPCQIPNAVIPTPYIKVLPLIKE